MPLWVVRHAPVAVAGLCYGQSDVETTVSPTESARRIAALLSREAAFGVVWSSPSRRCREIAAALATSWSIEPRVDPRLSELHFGDWEGKRYDDLERDSSGAFRRWAEHWEYATPPGGESLPMLLERVRDWLTAARSERHANALAITHAGVVRALRVILEGAAPSTAWASAVPCLEPVLLGGG